jgi:SAM-dependent methyltransferase
MWLDSLKHLVADKLALQVDAYTWHRYELIKPFLIRGPIRSLNIGTGGGVETLRLLGRGNQVTTIEYSEDAAQRTRERAVRGGYSAQHAGLTGHVLKVPLDAKFHQIMMCEVLEHIMDDAAVLKRLADWLEPGGRLILSTPTASYGQLPGDTLSTTEDGGHVRVGYDGPELDAMLARVGLVTQKRIFNSGLGPTWQHIVERRLRLGSGRTVGSLIGLASRPWMAVLDLVPVHPTDQITIATKLPAA